MEVYIFVLLAVILGIFLWWSILAISGLRDRTLPPR